MSVAIFVTVEILEDRLDEFREVMDLDVTESRKEPACLRFDLLQSADSPLKFHFYEIYKDADGLAAHKETPHYKKWVAFKESGGVASQTAQKGTGVLLQL
ncbi:unnamed protein product [Amoebophrya sp. A120]|nr:unnamed protein product [Amoebophrya sp. A120]|eukprot:GSA120T00017963001.1